MADLLKTTPVRRSRPTKTSSEYGQELTDLPSARGGLIEAKSADKDDPLFSSLDLSDKSQDETKPGMGYGDRIRQQSSAPLRINNPDEDEVTEERQSKKTVDALVAKLDRLSSSKSHTRAGSDYDTSESRRAPPDEEMPAPKPRRATSRQRLYKKYVEESPDEEEVDDRRKRPARRVVDDTHSAERHKANRKRHSKHAESESGSEEEYDSHPRRRGRRGRKDESDRRSSRREKDYSDHSEEEEERSPPKRMTNRRPRESNDENTPRREAGDNSPLSKSAVTRLAKNAGCSSVSSDVYEVVKKIALNFMGHVLGSVKGDHVSSADLEPEVEKIVGGPVEDLQDTELKLESFVKTYREMSEQLGVSLRKEAVLYLCTSLEFYLLNVLAEACELARDNRRTRVNAKDIAFCVRRDYLFSREA